MVTHHAPQRSWVAPRYRNDWLTPAFVSELPMSFFLGGAPQRMRYHPLSMVSVQRTHLERLARDGQDGVHQSN